MASICGVCPEKSKYKCPKCTTKYCSLKCFKLHQCTPKPTPILNAIVKPSELDLDEDEIHLANDDYQRLRTPIILTKLQSKKLQTLITEIDCSRAKISTLQKQLQSNKEFRIFCDDILKSLGFIDKEGLFNSCRSENII